MTNIIFGCVIQREKHVITQSVVIAVNLRSVKASAVKDSTLHRCAVLCFIMHFYTHAPVHTRLALIRRHSSAVRVHPSDRGFMLNTDDAMQGSSLGV